MCCFDLTWLFVLSFLSMSTMLVGLLWMRTSNLGRWLNLSSLICTTNGWFVWLWWQWVWCWVRSIGCYDNLIVFLIFGCCCGDYIPCVVTLYLSFGIFGGGNERSIRVFALMRVEFEGVDVVVFGWYMCCTCVNDFYRYTIFLEIVFKTLKFLIGNFLIFLWIHDCRI